MTPSSRRSGPNALPWLGLGAAAVYGFYDVAAFYDGFDLRQTGIQAVPKSEVLFYAWYLVFGTLAIAGFARALAHTVLPARVLSGLRAALATPIRTAGICALLALLGSVLFRRIALRGQVITDDELTYDFIAATLLEGRAANTPPIAPEFLSNQFVIANEHAWYGKYPLGHPLLLALGKTLHVQELVVPLIGAAGVVLTFLIGRRVLGERWAAIACVLLALSPQYVWTHGTQLSQPTTMLCLLLATLAWLRLQETGRVLFAGLGGLALGYGILARPLPGSFFVLAALAAYVIERRSGARAAGPLPHARELLLAGAGVAAGAGAVMGVNYVQSGDPWTSGYHAFHGGLELLDTGPGLVSASVGGALLRESLWLHGWPLSLAFVPFARFRKASVLLWGTLAAVLAYRILVPKTVVATTGPVYTLEVVPVLCLASAAGLARCTEWLSRTLPAERARELVVSTLLAATVVALALFLPLPFAAAHRAASARQAAHATLRNAGVRRAVVFASAFTTREQGLTWALFPPNPSPRLDDDIVFLRPLRGQRGYERMLQLARARFSDRRALVLSPTAKGFVLYDLPLRPGAPAPPELSLANSR